MRKRRRSLNVCMILLFSSCYRRGNRGPEKIETDSGGGPRTQPSRGGGRDPWTRGSRGPTWEEAAGRAEGEAAEERGLLCSPRLSWATQATQAGQPALRLQRRGRCRRDCGPGAEGRSPGARDKGAGPLAGVRGQRAKDGVRRTPTHAGHTRHAHTALNTPRTCTPPGFSWFWHSENALFYCRLFENVVIRNNTKNNDEDSQPSRGPGCAGNRLKAPRGLPARTPQPRCQAGTAFTPTSVIGRPRPRGPGTRSRCPPHSAWPGSTSHTGTGPFHAQTTKLRPEAPLAADRALGFPPPPPPQALRLQLWARSLGLRSGPRRPLEGGTRQVPGATEGAGEREDGAAPSRSHRPHPPAQGRDTRSTGQPRLGPVPEVPTPPAPRGPGEGLPVGQGLGHKGTLHGYKKE